MEVYTPDCMDYQFFPVTLYRKRIAIKASHDAHISFTSGESDTNPIVEIFLGAWENTKSVIRFNHESHDKAEEDTPGLLTNDEHREFTFEWAPNGTVFRVYGGVDAQPFLSWENTQPFQVTHFGVRTAWGATGDFICDDVNFIGTVDSMEYNYNPIQPAGGRVDLKVRAGNDAHVVLTSGPTDELPQTEIVLGGWQNSRCAIRHNRERPGVVEFDIAKPLDRDNYQRFVIDWSSLELKVSIGGAPDPFMVWNPRTAHPVSHFGIRTAYGSDGYWILPTDKVSAVPISCGAPDAFPVPPTGEGMGWVPPDVQVCPCPGGTCYPPPYPDGIDGEESVRTRRAVAQIPLEGVDWVEYKDGSFPEDAVIGGQDGGDPIYVARARHELDLIPGKLVPSHGVTYVAWGGKEHPKKSYEILVAREESISWVAGHGGSIPENAIPGGEADLYETLYIGRTTHNGTVTVGKIHPSHGSLYIPYGGKEVAFSEYEVLVKK